MSFHIFFWRYPITLWYICNMSKRQLLILLGIWNMMFLFLSFPAAWDKIFSLASGAIIITIAVALKPKEKPPVKGSVPFVEHKAGEDTTTDRPAATFTSADSTQIS